MQWLGQAVIPAVGSAKHQLTIAWLGQAAILAIGSTQLQAVSDGKGGAW